MKITSTAGGWKNIYHVGRTNAERYPALWIMHNNYYRMHFRIGTTNNGNDGLDFNIPQRSQNMNKWITIKMQVKYTNTTFSITAFVDGIEAGRRTVGGLPMNRPFETIWIKDPWHKRDGFDVQNVSIKGI
jgi:hypothetical protein